MALASATGAILFPRSRAKRHTGVSHQLTNASAGAIAKAIANAKYSDQRIISIRWFISAPHVNCRHDVLQRLRQGE
jgi:hypothetical protein